MDIQLLCFSQVFLEVVVCRVLYNNPAGVLIAFQERKIVGETWGPFQVWVNLSLHLFLNSYTFVYPRSELRQNYDTTARSVEMCASMRLTADPNTLKGWCVPKEPGRRPIVVN